MFKELLNETRVIAEADSRMEWAEKEAMLRRHRWVQLGSESKWTAPHGNTYSTAWLNDQPEKEFIELLKREKL